MHRTALVKRQTAETELVVEIDLDEYNDPLINSSIPFFDHMLDQLAKHSGFALRVEGTGDTEIDTHHLIEDTGIVLGRALNQALDKRIGIVRYASINLVFDEAMIRGAIDISGRPYFDGNLDVDGDIEGFPLEVLPEFFRAFTDQAKLTLHLDQLKPANKHHLAEASFKCLAKLLKAAVKIEGKDIPSTKGTLTD